MIANSELEFVKQLEYFFSLKSKAKNHLGKLGLTHLSHIVSRKAAKNILQHTLEDKHIVLSIVTYNQKIKLTQCLDSILEANLIPLDIARICVCADGAEWIWNRVRKACPEAKL